MCVVLEALVRRLVDFARCIRRVDEDQTLNKWWDSNAERHELARWVTLNKI
jgi:hypothetical protein